MSFQQRLLLAVGIFLVDAFFIVVPVAALVACYIILSRPEWFRDWVLKLYASE